MKNLFLSLTAFALTSCSVQGLTNDYKKLDTAQQQRIKPLQTFAEVSDGAIYKINGAQMRTELARHPKALVYVFTNGCTSKHCKPLMVYEAFAQRNNYKLFLVMNGYRELSATLEQPVSSPLYSIDNEHYGKSWRSVYTNYFNNDMLGKPVKEKEKVYLGNLYFFEGGKLKEILMDLPAG